MIQVEDEYELHRDPLEYMLTIEYEWIYYKLDHEGCPIYEKGDPLVEVKCAQVLNCWQGERCIVDYDTGPYPILDPPLTEQETRDFEEFLCDQAGPDV